MPGSRTGTVITIAIAAFGSALPHAAAAQGRAEPTLTAPSQPPAKASVVDSLAAEKKAWIGLREMVWTTGTKAYKAMKAVNGRAGIVVALGTVPGDEWLNDLRFALPLAGTPAGHTVASRARCRASVWLCDMQQALGLHRTGAAIAADSVVRVALSRMPETVRCIWGDVGSLIGDKAARKSYEQRPCAERVKFEEILWWLSDPLFSEPGNERRAEHFGRQMNLQLQQEQKLTNPRSVPGFPWSLKIMRRSTHLVHGTDLLPEDLIVEADTTEPPPKKLQGFLDRAAKGFGGANLLGSSREYTVYQLMERQIKTTRIGRPPTGVPNASASFVPSAEAILSPFTSIPNQWSVSGSGTETSYSPIGAIVAVDHQHALFRRGDSARLVVVTDASLNAFLKGTLMNGALARMRSPYDSAAITRIQGANRFAFSPMVPGDSMVVSLEIVALNRGGGRARFGSALKPRATGRLDISDIALLDSNSVNNSLSTTLDAILPRVLSSTNLHQSAVGLFWEVYGLAAGDRPTVTISYISESSGGVVRSIAGVFGGGQQTRTQQFSYQDMVAGGEPIEGRTFVLDTSILRAGSYTIEVQVQVPGEPAVASRRQVEVVRR